MEDSEEEKNKIREFCRDLVNFPTPTELLWTGSYFELPAKFFFNNMTDLDTIVYPRHICALPFNYKANALPIKSYLELKKQPDNTRGITVLGMYSKESHPGFTQLLRDWDVSKSCRYSRKHLRRDSEKKACVTINLMRSSDPILRYFIYLNYMGNGIFDRNEITYDWVEAILCPVWPEEAREWINRERRYGWPSNVLIGSVVKSGCFLVSKPHQNNAGDEGEWRISFSKAELSLIHSWNDVQMYIYHILRLVKNDIVKICGGNDICHLKTYHLKTLMLWTCEEKSPEFWDEINIETTLKELLCTMIEWLNRKECRNYFISDNNMFDHLSSDFCFENEIQNLLLSVERIQFYINKTSHLRNDRNNEIFLRIPSKFLLTLHLWFYQEYAITPSLTERQRYKPLDASEETNCFRTKAAALYKALCIHKDLLSCKTSNKHDVNNMIDLALDRFKFCQRSSIDGYSKTIVSSSENGHEIVKKISMIRVENNTNNIITIPQLSSVDALTQAILLDLAQSMNDGIDDPFYFLSSAYLANFHYTAFDEDTRSAGQWRRALSLSHHLTCHYDNLVKKYGSFGIYEPILCVIISRKWVTIFDKYIQTVFGFYVLCSAFLNSNGQCANGCENRDVVVHINAVDFLKYVLLQCNRKLSAVEGFAIDDRCDVIQMKTLIFHHSTTALLYSALHSR